MRLLGIFPIVFLGAFCTSVNCNPVELGLNSSSDSSSAFGSAKIQREPTITMTTPVATEITTTTTRNKDNPVLGNVENVEETPLERGKCSENLNRTKSKTRNERLIPFPLCKPIQGIVYTGLCAVVCNLPLKSDENSCRFSNEDKTIFCDCDGAEEGDSAACGSGLEKVTHCAHPELSPPAKTCRAICRKLGKSYDFCMSSKHARRSFCTCFDASRTQRKGNQREIEDISESESESAAEETQVPVPVSAPIKQVAVLKQEEIPDGGEVDDDIDVDVDLKESCEETPKNGTVIQKLRQQNTGPCHPVVGLYKIKVCNGICGSGPKTCRVSRDYKTVFCDCPGNQVGPDAFCGRNAEMFRHCFASTFTTLEDCQSLCTDLGKRGAICINPQNSQTLSICSCFAQ